jgi:hypothetical protein
MNPGNLAAFRNFILKKLNKDKQTESAEATNVYCQPLDGCYDNGNHGNCTRSDYQNFDDFFKGIDFNPDSLLSSEQQPSYGKSNLLSPFSMSLTSDSPDPFSPSLSYTDGNPSPTNNDDSMDINGFFHFFNPQPISDDHSFLHDFDNIFKTDADPLLGGISS